MPMLTTVRMRRRWHRATVPLRTCSANSPIAPSTSWTSGTTFVVAVGADRPDHGAAVARRATCSTARSSVTLIRSPREHRVAALGDAGGAGDGEQGDEHGVVDALLGVVDAQVADGDHVALGRGRDRRRRARRRWAVAGSAVSSSHCGVVVMSTG